MEDVDAVIPRTPQGPVRTTGIPAKISSTYSHITAGDNSRVHAGHVFHFHCTTQHHFDVAGAIPQTILKRKRSLADIGAAPRTREAQEDLEYVLKKLGKLALSIRGRRGRETGADKIARRISAVFDALVTHCRDEDAWDEVVERQARKLKANVEWEEQFDINSVPHRRAVGRNARARGRRISAEIGHWNISLTTTTVESGRAGGLQETEIFSVLRIEPRLEVTGSALAVYFSEHTNGHVRSSISPTVMAYNKLSDDAEVFDLVSKDDLEGLRRLLAGGKATTRDCDESDRSLLHYACEFQSLRCCSFLIGCGVDVDRSELSFEGVIYESPLEVSYMASNARYPDHPCFEVLLRAGADPTIVTTTAFVRPIFLEILRHDFDVDFLSSLLKTILIEASSYIDFRDRFDQDQGQGYWLALCTSPRFLKTPELLQVCVNNGADIGEVDQRGFNCLFIFMAEACEPNIDMEYKALRSLLSIFDDVFARDALGNDIFTYVNELQDWPVEYHGREYSYGSYRQDLWYCALMRSKLDVSYNIEPCTRIARYTQFYTPEHYLSLCYLDNWFEYRWDEEEFGRQIQDVLKEHPFSLTDDEKCIQRDEERKRQSRIRQRKIPYPRGKTRRNAQ